MPGHGYNLAVTASARVKDGYGQPLQVRRPLEAQVDAGRDRNPTERVVDSGPVAPVWACIRHGTVQHPFDLAASCFTAAGLGSGLRRCPPALLLPATALKQPAALR